MAAIKAAPKKKKKLTKDDPEFYSTIAKMAGQSLLKKKGKSYFSDLAKKSHGPKSKRDGYHGGRPKKDQSQDA